MAGYAFGEPAFTLGTGPGEIATMVGSFGTIANELSASLVPTDAVWA
jgi:hypothetical protein